jgi:hypothetical protein
MRAFAKFIDGERFGRTEVLVDRAAVTAGKSDLYHHGILLSVHQP